jgi:hypothetical protein
LKMRRRPKRLSESSNPSEALNLLSKADNPNPAVCEPPNLFSLEKR